VLPWAEALTQQRRENLGKDAPNLACLPLGPASITQDSTAVQTFKIIQTPNLIAIIYPNLSYRQIFMDGRALETDPNPSWMGYSVGRWEGDTLVIESNGWNDRTWLDQFGHPHTEKLRTIERYRRPDFGHLEVELTLDDPAAYRRPWTVALKADLLPDTELLEYVCAESKSNREHWVGTASDDRKSEVKVAPEILSQYVGTYKEQGKLWSIEPRTVAITFSDGVLYGDLDGRGKMRLFASSETSFAGLNGLGLEFAKDGLYVKHVSGDYWFARQPPQ
jgi:hypothetical protein